MSWVENMNINLFPMVLVLVVLISNRVKVGKPGSSRVFDLIIIFDFLLMFIDIIGVESAQRLVQGNGMWVVNVVRMLLTVLLTTTWFIYVCLKISLECADKRALAAISVAVVIAVIACFIVLLIPHEYLMQYGLERAGKELRVCYLGISYLGISMFAASAFVALYGALHEANKEMRKMSIYLIVFSLLPILGVTMQNINQTFRTSSPCLSLAVLYVYITMQNKRVMTDSLTGVNNRRELDAYLERRGRQQGQNEWGMLMIDVDDFKQINDSIGHKLGDDALWNVADILRTKFASDGCFVARYGGDEFVVCGEWNSMGEMEHIRAGIEKCVERFNNEKVRPYKLSLSVGIALWSECGCDVTAVLEAADKDMYEQKQMHKERRKSNCEHCNVY